MYIELKNVSKSIKGVKILSDISLKMESGKIYGFQGKNGCGKTMLMRAICGLIRIDSGSININGKILHKDIPFPESIGVLIENPSFLNNFTGFKNLRMLADIQGNISDDDIFQILDEVGLDSKDKRTYKKYSLGMKQKLGIAAAVMGTPNIVILDEPINAIDESGVDNVRNILHNIREKGSVVIIACHDKNELKQLSDIIIHIENGRITDDE
ncbi:MAG: ATP-binding cassette domain-containing protein [Ruminococcus sp.]|nr:ATP-binding cassette domain-containing protein [Ruminococcus sp.]